MRKITALLFGAALMTLSAISIDLQNEIVVGTNVAMAEGGGEIPPVEYDPMPDSTAGGNQSTQQAGSDGSGETIDDGESFSFSNLLFQVALLMRF